MPSFQYSPEIPEKFPNIYGGIILAHGMKNSATSQALAEYYAREQESIRLQIGDMPLSEIPSIEAWRRAFSAFGVAPTKYRSAAESLLRRLTKKGDIPSINTLVDIGNLVSIRYRLPVAVVDTREILGGITVHFSDGTENYTELGTEGIIHPELGEVIFSDDKKMVFARRWCWRQSDTCAANENTSDAIITVEAHHETGLEDVSNAVNDLIDLLKEHAGGTYTYAILSKDNPAI